VGGRPLLEVGRVVKPHGLRGEVVVALVSNRPERMAAGSVLIATGQPLVVEHARPFEATGSGRWLVGFEGISSLEAAQRLRGLVLTALPLDDPGALWAHELIGAVVVSPGGEELGTIEAIEANPASDLLVLQGGGLIPLHFVVNHGGGRVVVDIPPGLLEL